VDDAWEGIVECVPFEGYLLARFKVSQHFLCSGHVGLACGGHVSCENRYDPADLEDLAGLEEKQTAYELLVFAQEYWVLSGRHLLKRCEDLDELA